MTDQIAPTPSTALVPVTSTAFMPVLSLQDSIMRYNALVEFTQKLMKPDKDFGCIPGTDKPTLLKPGAEKLCSLFGFTPDPVIVDKVEDWMGAGHGGEPFFYYRYRVSLYRGSTLIAAGEGSCNSMESKYRYRWVGEQDLPAGTDKATLKTRGGKIAEFAFAIEKAETTGKYGKPAAYWRQFQDAIDAGTAKAVMKKTRGGSEMDAWEIDTLVYRVPNPDIADQVNTIQKMAVKRALIAATLIGANASEFYTQDIEDLDIVEGAFTVVAQPAPAATSTPADKPATQAKAANGNGGNGNGEADGNGRGKKPADIKCPSKDFAAQCVELAKRFTYYQIKGGKPDMAKVQWSLPAVGFSVITAANLEPAFEALATHAAEHHPNKADAGGGPVETRPADDAETPF